LGIVMSFSGVILVRFISFHLSGYYQILVNVAGYLLAGSGLVLIAVGVKKTNQDP